MEDGKLLAIILSSNLLVALISLASAIIMFKLNRKATKEDKKEAKNDATSSLGDRVDTLETKCTDAINQYHLDMQSINKSIQGLVISQRMILFDRRCELS